MKTLFKVLYLFLAMTLIFTQCDKDDPINSVDIPDNAFLNALIEKGVDTNGNGKISYAEAEVVTGLNIYSYNISDMTGIEAFINLGFLVCDNNQMTSLDVSNNTALTQLICYNNQLTSLDVSNNTALTYLQCEENKLTSLDVSNNADLIGLYCFNNQLTTLDVSGCNALAVLQCEENKLTSLDVSHNSALWSLTCEKNQLTTLDVSNNSVLGDLWCGSNQLISLDVTNNPSLYTLDLRDMPTLKEVCVWTMPFPPEGVWVEKDGSPNVFFTTECSELESSIIQAPGSRFGFFHAWSNTSIHLLTMDATRFNVTFPIGKKHLF